jgi:hypothetical protein
MAVLNDLEPPEPKPEWRTHYTAGGLVERDRQHAAAGPTVIVRSVCESCNTGWMASLEGRVRPVLEPMIRGKTVSLTVEQQLDAATWASKTIIALESFEPTATVARMEDRRLVREQLRPPVHHLVRLAYRSEYLEPVATKFAVARSESAPDERPDAFAVTLAVGFLIIQVWGGHGAETDGGLTRVGTKIGRAIMVWPPVLGVVSWPPAHAIEDNEFDEFASEVIPWADDSPDVAEWRKGRQSND